MSCVGLTRAKWYNMSDRKKWVCPPCQAKHLPKLESLQAEFQAYKELRQIAYKTFKSDKNGVDALIFQTKPGITKKASFPSKSENIQQVRKEPESEM